jgi:3-oxoacyl-[acyl-carrier-protein] synthase-3
MNTLQPVGIVAIGAFAPEGVLTNADLEKLVETSDAWILSRTGISTRHIADADTATSDIAYQSALLALERARLTPDALDLIIVATITPDQPLPSTACLLQHRLGATHAAAFDLGAACTGFIYGLSVGAAMVGTGQYRNALVIGADLLSRVTDYTDRSVCVLLGDGAGAAVLQPVPEGRGILASYLRADGGGKSCLEIPAGGSRLPASAETLRLRQHYLHMNGAEVFKFAVRAIEDAATTVIAKAGLTMDDIALVVPHQANNRIIDAASKRLGIPVDRWVSNIARFGNTSAASIPMALNEAYEAGRVQEGDTILLLGFGGGLTWGSCIIRW